MTRGLWVQFDEIIFLDSAFPFYLFIQVDLKIKKADIAALIELFCIMPFHSNL